MCAVTNLNTDLLFALVFKVIVFVPFNIPGRAEMLCKLEEVRREMESRLDSQRRHMVQKESQLKNEVEELKVTCSFLHNILERPAFSLPYIHPLEQVASPSHSQRCNLESLIGQIGMFLDCGRRNDQNNLLLVV